MFDLSDKRGKRRRIIFGEAQIDAQKGVVMAAIDFEWTCRRAVLALSKNPAVNIYDKFLKELAEVTDGSKRLMAWLTSARQFIDKCGEDHLIKTCEIC